MCFSTINLYCKQIALYSIFSFFQLTIRILRESNVELLVLILDTARNNTRKLCDGPSHIPYRLVYSTFLTESIAYSCSRPFSFTTNLYTLTEELCLNESS
jgi:hypothetical protein